MGDFAIVTGHIFKDENSYSCELFQVLVDEDVQHDMFDGLYESIFLEQINFPSDLEEDYFFTAIVRVHFISRTISWEIGPEPDIEYDVREVKSCKDFFKQYSDLS